MRMGSVQGAFVAVRDIVDGVLCLAWGERTEYRALVGISSVHFALKSEKEQEAMLAAYAAVLNGISYPLQILTQVRPLNLVPYLSLVREERARTRVHEHDVEMTALWDRLTEEYVTFVTGLTAQRTILERRFVLVIPAENTSTPPVNDPLRRFLAQLPWPGHQRREQVSAQQTLALAKQQLDLRANTMIEELARVGLIALRLTSAEVLEMWYHAVSPTRAGAHPLTPEVIDHLALPSHAVHRVPIVSAKEVS